jgi:alanyl-tRNA synthetase
VNNLHHNEVVDQFLGYFSDRGHHPLSDASLIPPEGDTSGLFVNSGMHVIKPYFYGSREPPASRLCSVQKCIRTNDIDDVGTNRRTLTFFAMLGSWSIGDYGREEAMPFAHDLLTNGFGLEPDKLWVTYFGGDDKVPEDLETKLQWEKVGLPEDRIIGLGAEDNFWSAGATGLCGPCTEVYYDRGEEYGCDDVACKPGCDCDRYLEIWNAGVFMQYDRQEDGSLKDLPMKSIDTGAGLERIAMLLQGVSSAYDTTLFAPIVASIESAAGGRSDAINSGNKSVRIIADHVRAASALIAEGLMPSNTDRGYILRRLLRRSVNHASMLGIDKDGLASIVSATTAQLGEDYDHIRDRSDHIKDVATREYKAFARTLRKGQRELEKALGALKGSGALDPAVAFRLFDTHGFPVELTAEICEERGVLVDMSAFDALMEAHRERSRASAAGRFRSGLADQSVMSTRYHTATHLLHQALRDVLGDTVEQKGSNINPERLRFDFSYERALTRAEIESVEEIVNARIDDGLEVICQEMDTQAAIDAGAIGLFGDKYGKTVSVYSVGSYSKELCQGPHVSNTSELGLFKIKKEQSSSAGVRRIKAVLKDGDTPPK